MLKTVPTLCATATIVGASGVGLSIGQSDPSKDPPDHLPFPTSTAVGHDPMSSARLKSAGHTKQTSIPPLALSSTGHTEPAARRSHDTRASLRRLRRKTTGDAVPQILEDTTKEGMTVAGASEARAESRGSARPLRPRSSWAKRLSTFSSSPTTSSRESSPGPLSPSHSWSNGSMAFSHDGSTAPMMGKRPPSPLPPNKLVKRSSSLRATSGSAEPGSKFPTLRRPATSHQRSATLSHRASLMDITAEETYRSDASAEADKEQREYKRYFRPKVSRLDATSKKRAASGETKTIRRILPDGKYQPTLLLAKSVAARSVEVDDDSSLDDASIFFSSRPATPLNPNFFSSSRNSTTLDRNTNNPVPEEASTSRPRRSFSISDLLSSSSSQKRSRLSRIPGGKLLRRTSRRVVSEPLSSMGNRQVVTSHETNGGASPISKEEFTFSYPRSQGRDTAPVPASDSSSVFTKTSFTTAESRQPHPQASMSSPADTSSGAVQKAPSRPADTFTTTGRSFSSDGIRRDISIPKSRVASEQASTLIGSSSEDDSDLRSDTLYDSVQTRTTRSTSGAPKPSIDTIFDEPPAQSVDKPFGGNARDFSFTTGFAEGADNTAHDIIMEEDEVPSNANSAHATPSRSNVVKMSQPPLDRAAAGYDTTSSSEVPREADPPSWRIPSHDDDTEWSVNEEEPAWSDDESPSAFQQVATPVAMRRSSAFLVSSTTPPNGLAVPSAESQEKDRRSSIFDWSEQQASDKTPSNPNHSPPRPKTVHGKKDTDGRGSRPVGRRAPSGVHARSQSVPVVPELNGKREVVANKFGTWGVGSKLVTEDWDEDFDFDEPEAGTAPKQQGSDEGRLDSGVAMVVPKSIRDQQRHVLAHIGLLREWGLLIEELKELRARASSLHIVEGPYNNTFREVDAMIALADQEVDEPPIAADPDSSSSPGFDLDTGEDTPSSNGKTNRIRRSSGLWVENDIREERSPSSAAAGRHARKSVLPPNDDIFSSNPPETPTRLQSSDSPQLQKVVEDPTINNLSAFEASPAPVSHRSPPVTTPRVGRPRHDSEAMAQSVIKALQQRSSSTEPIQPQPISRGDKLHFDTATLKHIVPHVHTLMRRVKESIREAEGLASSPASSPNPNEPPISQMFKEQSFQVHEKDLAAQMKLMTVM